MNRVTDLKIGESLTIIKGNEVITWLKKSCPRSIYMIRRLHFKGGKLLLVLDNHKLGTADDDELAFRKSQGWKIVKIRSV